MIFWGNFGGEKTKWSEEINGLKEKLQNQSPVCAFVNATKEILKNESTIKWVFEEFLPTDMNAFMIWTLITEISKLILILEFELILKSVFSFFITGIFALKFKLKLKLKWKNNSKKSEFKTAFYNKNSKWKITMIK